MAKPKRPKRQTRRSDADKSTRVPSFSYAYTRRPGESCHDFAKSVMDGEYENKGGWERKGRQGRQYSEIQKRCEAGGYRRR